MRRGINYELESEYELFAESFSNYDVIDSRIDVGAQKALIRMKGNPATSADAAEMLAAVKSGQLAGIFGDDLRAAAQLASRLDTVRWELVPRGQVAALIRERNASAPPTIIFRAQYRGDRQRLDPALAAVWRNFLDGLYASALGERDMEAFDAPRRRSGREYIIIGTDDRRLVTNTLSIPFRFVCCLAFEFVNPNTGDRLFRRGSGTLISDRHVLTAAHNVLNDMSQVVIATPGIAPFPTRYLRATNMMVAPARNDRILHGNSSSVTAMRVSRPWQATANRQTALGNINHIAAPQQSDYALLTLRFPLGAREPLPVTMQLPPPPLGWWGHRRFGGNTRIRAYDTALLRRLRNETVNLSGYPVDKCRSGPRLRAATAAEIAACTGHVPDMEEFRDIGSTQWHSSGQLVNPFQATGLITYNLDSVAGHSGGPIWLNWEGFRNLLAIHTGNFNAAANRGILITGQLLSQLRTWMRADRVEPTF